MEFQPKGSTSETVGYRVVLNDVNMLQLLINPDISGGQAIASLSELRLA